MLGADSQGWVVKFRNNPQHKRILANEYIVSGLARSIGLSVPPSAVVCVGRELVDISPSLIITGPHGKVTPCACGPQFASQYAGGLMPSFVLDYLPDERFRQVVNLREFLGVLALDKWTGNSDGRQAVFVRTQMKPSYKAIFIDFGHCFNAGSWTFPDLPLAGSYGRKSVYANVTGWESFEPWLSKLEDLPIDLIWQLSKSVPEDWYEGDVHALEKLISTLDKRRGSIRQLIHEYRKSGTLPFPNWPAESKKRLSAHPLVPAWSASSVVPFARASAIFQNHAGHSPNLP
jgi:hypothetical protein